MTTSYPVLSPEERKPTKPMKKRSAWRARLIDAERGFSFGFRSGSALFTQIFIGLSIIVTAMVFRVSFAQWIALIVAMAAGLAAELFHLAILLIADSLDSETPQKAAKLSAAALLMAMIASSTVILFVLGTRLSEILD
ncbi:MAG: diacylglycerol kinase [Planctomycetaceae bacterium]|nr:diacylglycerol kinase [Planctomycetaceae bacterium]